MIDYTFQALSCLPRPINKSLMLWNHFFTSVEEILHKYWENNVNNFTGTLVATAWQFVPQHCSLYPFSYQPLSQSYTKHVRSTKSRPTCRLSRISALLNWSLNSLGSLLICFSVFFSKFSVDCQAQLSLCSISSLRRESWEEIGSVWFMNLISLNLDYKRSSRSSEEGGKIV